MAKKISPSFTKLFEFEFYALWVNGKMTCPFLALFLCLVHFTNLVHDAILPQQNHSHERSRPEN